MGNAEALIVFRDELGLNIKFKKMTPQEFIHKHNQYTADIIAFEQARDDLEKQYIETQAKFKEGDVVLITYQDYDITLNDDFTTNKINIREEEISAKVDYVGFDDNGIILYTFYRIDDRGQSKTRLNVSDYDIITIKKLAGTS